MKLHPEWKTMLKKAWSLRLMAFAGLLSGAEATLPLFSDNIPRNMFGGLLFMVIASAFIARLVAQRGIDGQ